MMVPAKLLWITMGAMVVQTVVLVRTDLVSGRLEGENRRLRRRLARYEADTGGDIPDA